MTDHRRANVLAAEAIDFELNPKERAELDAHLGSCAACRTAAAQLRRQATALSGRPRVAPPAGFRHRLETAPAARWPRRSSSSGLRLALNGAVAIAAILAIAFALPRLAVYVGQISSPPTPTPTEIAGVGPVRNYVLLAGSHSITSAPSHCHGAPASDCVTDVRSVLGAVWVTTSDSIMRFDPVSETIVANIPVGSFPHRIWFADGSLWTTVQRPGALVRIDPASNTVIASVPVGGLPVGIVDAGGSIWVVDAEGDRVVEVDPATNTIVGATPLPIHPWSITATGAAVWLADTTARVLVRIDPTSAKVVATITLPDVVASGETSGSGADIIAGFDRLWLTMHGGISAYDPVSGNVESAITQADPRIAIGSDRVWVVGDVNVLIQSFDPSKLAITGQSILYVSDGLSAGFEMSVDVDQNGVLWAATDEGNRLVKITPAQ